MPSSLAEALAERLLERLPPDRDYDRAALEEAATTGEPSLPRTVRHFLERMMARRVEIERERLRVLRQPWLDHEHEEVRRAEEGLLEAVRRHVRIPAAAWERVLRHACECVTAHLVRPAPALEDFVFGSDVPESGEGAEDPDTLPSTVVMRRLGYFAAYPYLRKAASAYVEQREVAAFPRERLAALLHRVDEKMCAGHDPEDWLRLLQPLFALSRRAYPHHDGLSIELLEAFFEEKKADLPLQRLRTARREHDLSVLSPSALAEVIADAPSFPQPSPGDQAETPEASPPEAHLPSEETPAADAGESNVPEADDIRGAEGHEDQVHEDQVHEDQVHEDQVHEDQVREDQVREDQVREDQVREDQVREASPTAPPEPSNGSPASNERDAEAEEAYAPERPSPEAPPPERSTSTPDEEAAPLWKRFLGTSAPPDEQQEPPAPSPSEGERDARPRWQQFSAPPSEEENAGHEAVPERERPAAPPARESAGASPSPGDASPATPQALRPLEEDVLGRAAGHRALFVRELFDGSEESYARVLRRLREADDWGTATQIIARDVFRAHGVNIYSDSARSFTDAVESSFR